MENNAILLTAASLGFIHTVLAQVVRAHGVSKMAKKVSLSRAGVYKTLSKKGNPELKTFMGILNASGLQMSFKPAHIHQLR